MQLKDNITTERFNLRVLTGVDVTDTYLSWVQNPDAKKYIINQKSLENLQSLKTYVEQKWNDPKVILWGIFDKNGLHIGNVKYEPLDIEKKFAVMGILIGDPDWRGKAVADEVIRASASFLKERFKIRYIVLGVQKDNPSAIKAYEKIGFKITEQNYIHIHDKGLGMILNLEQ